VVGAAGAARIGSVDTEPVWREAGAKFVTKM
jgi:hypothetical protein